MKNKIKKIIDHQFEIAEELYKELEELYDESSIRVQDELLEFYDKLDEVSIRDSRKVLTKNQLNSLKRNIKYFLTDNISSGWEKELDKYLKRSRISRLDGFLIVLYHEVDRIIKIESEKLEELAEKIYNDSYYRELYEISKKLEKSKIFNRSDIGNLINKKWADDNKNIKERLWERKTKINNYLRKNLVQSIKRGEDPAKMINRVSKRFNTSRYQSGRLVMTETAYYHSNAQEQLFKELDVEEYQIIATLDDRTSEICQDMDLMVFKMSEFEVGVTAPPFHVFCRSVTIPYFSDITSERIARDSNGEWYNVPRDISYKEWRDNYVR